MTKMYRRPSPSGSVPTTPVFATVLLVVAYGVLPFGMGYPFKDVSQNAGMRRPFGRRKKFGGPAIADLDGDGWPDLLFGHHGGPDCIQVYFNNGDGTFTLSDFTFWRDLHGIAPLRLHPRDRRMHFILSGGGRRGTRPMSPHIFRVLKNRTIIEVTEYSPDFNATVVRGRTAIPLSMRRNPRSQSVLTPELLLLNKKGIDDPPDAPIHYAFQVDQLHPRHSRLQSAQLGRPKLVNSYFNTFGAVTDVDGDGVVELVLLDQLRIWALTEDFTYINVTRRLLPAANPDETYYAAWSVAELDFDNDGRWDLFVARSATGQLSWYTSFKRRPPISDFLFRNVEGKRYEDVSESSGVNPPLGMYTAASSHAVTTGDFDNDGFIDIFLTRYDARPSYLLLRNRGDGTFERAPIHFSRPPYIDGDGVAAVDYDGDGRIDLVVSEGSWDYPERGGFYRILRNVWVTSNNFLIVRVKSAPKYSATSLHATVTVKLPDGTKLMRRVGSPGTTVSSSYIELVHFGIGQHTICKRVTVRWVNGEVRYKKKSLRTRL